MVSNVKNHLFCRLCAQAATLVSQEQSSNAELDLDPHIYGATTNLVRVLCQAGYQNAILAGLRQPDDEDEVSSALTSLAASATTTASSSAHSPPTRASKKVRPISSPLFVFRRCSGSTTSFGIWHGLARRFPPNESVPHLEISLVVFSENQKLSLGLLLVECAEQRNRVVRSFSIGKRSFGIVSHFNFVTRVFSEWRRGPDGHKTYGEQLFTTNALCAFCIILSPHFHFLEPVILILIISITF
jgi:hypothetical protein